MISKNPNLWPSSWTTSIFSFLLAGIALAVAAALSSAPPALLAPSEDDKRRIRIACLGNSIQYYNDCPRLLERMFQGWDMQQNSCLKGGSTIITLWEKGNGMRHKFGTPNAQLPDGSYDIGAPTVKSLLEDETFDVVIINDHTQSPARESSRAATLQLLKEEYVPLLKKSRIRPIFLMTAGYRLPNIRGTEDLGDFDHYTKLLQEGYQTYKQQMSEFLEDAGLEVSIAPVGMAYAKIHHTDQALWKRLYHTDDFHPSPHGTLLQAYVLYTTLTNGEVPPTNYDISWWDRARVMQPAGEEPLPRPTVQEAKILREIAIQVCRENSNVE